MLAGSIAFHGAGTADKTKAVGEPQPPVVLRSVTETDCFHTSAPDVPPWAFGKAQKTSRWLPDCRSSTWMRQAPDGSHAHIATEVTEAPPRLNCRLSLRIYPEGRAVRRIALTDIQPSSDAFPAPRNSGLFLRFSVNQESQVAIPETLFDGESARRKRLQDVVHEHALPPFHPHRFPRRGVRTPRCNTGMQRW